jgi:hypothetical protein
MDVVWQSLAWPGLEHLRWDGRRADGCAVMVLPDEGPQRVLYHIDTAYPGGCRVEINGREIGVFPEVDIAVTPFTNTLPIRRMRLDIGAGESITVAYLHPPAFEPVEKHQRYTRLGERTYRYESSGFEATLTVDEHDLVVDYPDLWRRISTFPPSTPNT